VVPPRWIRRLVLAPAIGLLTLLLITTIPLTAIIAAFASPLLPGRLRPLRILAFVLLFLVAETLTLVALFALWIASGFGRRVGSPRWQAAHYALMRTHLRVLVHAAQRTFNLGIDIDPPIAPPGSSGEPSRPLIVLSRHAGPGDSFLLVHALLERGRRPRIVLRDTLKWAPVLDVLLHRVPSVFLTPGNARQRTSARIAALATTLGPRDALVLFPEGRNFTPTRRLHSITRLEELGRHSEADQAREMRHVLTPRPGGALAALRAAPIADVVFVGHTGLEGLSSIVDLWRGLPMDTRVKARAWRVPAGEAPRNGRSGADWLLDWWRHIDAWIVETQGVRAVPDAVAEAVEDVR
jgi:1-acyl-sn-glycerol-3-phosphate acyltransferase